MQKKHTRKLLGIAVTGAVLLTACQTAPISDEVSTTPAGDNLTPPTTNEETKIVSTVTVENQDLKGDTVIVKEAIIDEQGWATIHNDNQGTFGDVIGYASISKGTNPDITVKIDQTKATEKLYAMLHYDRGNATVYEFPGVDAPVTVNSEVVIKDFTVKIEKPAETPSKTQPAATEKKEETKAETSVKSFTVTASQFKFTPETIEVNKGDTVRLAVTSADVSHGISISQFGINKVLNPSETVNIEFVANEVGSFPIVCSIVCGEGHTGMKGTLVVK